MKPRLTPVWFFLALILGIGFFQNSFAQGNKVCDFGTLEVIRKGESVCQGGLVPTINWIIGIVTAAVIAIGMIVFVVAGYVYMTAGGNAQRIGLAKTLIGAALTGIVLALVAQLLLNTISPQFAREVAEPPTPPPTKVPER